MDLQLTNKQALVTGSTAGIGFAIASLLAEEGASVVVNGRAPRRVEQAVERIRTERKNTHVTGIAVDLGTKAGVDLLIRDLPAVDILVNNLGIFEPKPFGEITDADWLRFFEVNVLSGARLSRFYLPRMLQMNWGRIVFISSESGVNIPVEMIHYGVTKTAQIALARPGRVNRRHCGDGQFGAARPDAFRGRQPVRAGPGERTRHGCGAGRSRFLPHRPPHLAAEAICDAGGSGGNGGVCVQPPGFGQQRRGAACRRRCGPVHRVRIEQTASSIGGGQPRIVGTRIAND